MVEEGEANAEADRKRVEVISARNSAESAINGFTADLAAYGSAVKPEEKEAAESALAELRTAAEGEDAADINTKLAAVYAAFNPVTAAKAAAEAKSPADPEIVDAEVKEAA